MLERGDNGVKFIDSMSAHFQFIYNQFEQIEYLFTYGHIQ